MRTSSNRINRNRLVCACRDSVRECIHTRDKERESAPILSACYFNFLMISAHLFYSSPTKIMAFHLVMRIDPITMVGYEKDREYGAAAATWAWNASDLIRSLGDIDSILF